MDSPTDSLEPVLKACDWSGVSVGKCRKQAIDTDSAR